MYKDLYPIETVQMAKNPFFTDNLPAVAWEHWKDVRQGEDIPLSRRVPDYFEPMPDKYHVSGVMKKPMLFLSVLTASRNQRELSYRLNIPKKCTKFTFLCVLNSKNQSKVHSKKYQL